MNTSEPHKAQVRTSGRVLKPHKIHGTPANRLEVITLQAERVALRKGMIDLRLAELREGHGCATMRILDDRSLIALKLPADYRIARPGSVRFPSHSAARIADT